MAADMVVSGWQIVPEARTHLRVRERRGALSSEEVRKVRGVRPPKAKHEQSYESTIDEIVALVEVE